MLQNMEQRHTRYPSKNWRVQDIFFPFGTDSMSIGSISLVECRTNKSLEFVYVTVWNELISFIINIKPILLKYATHRAVIMNTPYGLAQKICY